MAKITISNLLPAGSDLFSDSESFMSELSSSEMEFSIQGGSVYRTEPVPVNDTVYRTEPVPAQLTSYYA